MINYLKKFLIKKFPKFKIKVCKLNKKKMILKKLIIVFNIRFLIFLKKLEMNIFKKFKKLNSLILMVKLLLFLFYRKNFLNILIFFQSV